MKKVILLTESDLIKIIKTVISESTSKDLEGRKFVINPDGTVSIQNNKGQMPKIRITTSLGDINVANIEKTEDGYKITGKKGSSKEVETDIIRKIINFVDYDKPSKIPTGMLTPSLQLTKV